ncbi:MAG: RNA polymerase sigma factor [Planctomycetota bacterium JB042]
MEHDSDLADLVSRSRDRDQAAFGRLVSRLTPTVLSIVRHRIRDEHDANAVANDAFTHVRFGLPKLERPEQFRSWLVAVTLRRVLMYHRGRNAEKRRPDRTGDATPEPTDDATPLGEALLAEIRAEIRKLPPELADVVDAKYFQRLTLREIAEPRDLTIDQVFRRLGRALERLGRRLGGGRGSRDPGFPADDDRPDARS